MELSSSSTEPIFTSQAVKHPEDINIGFILSQYSIFASQRDCYLDDFVTEAYAEDENDFIDELLMKINEKLISLLLVELKKLKSEEELTESSAAMPRETPEIFNQIPSQSPEVTDSSDVWALLQGHEFFTETYPNGRELHVKFNQLIQDSEYILSICHFDKNR